MATDRLTTVAAPARVADGAPVRLAALGLGLLGALVGAFGSWIPSAWSDEAATMSAAQRPWADLPRLLTHIDAVHGLYYALAHAWTSVAGPSVVGVRVLSALAVGAAVAGTVVLGARLHSTGAGVASGVVLLVLPRMTWAATEARSSAVATAAAVWITVLLVSALRSSGRRRWVAYGVAVALGTVLWLLLAALPVAHALAVWWGRHERASRVRQGVAGAAGLVVAAPFVLWATGQSGQVSWIPGPSLRTVRQLAVDQLFGTAGALALPLAVVGWVLVLLLVLRAWRPGAEGSSLVALGVPWLVVPTLAAVAWSFVGAPLYVPKYLSFTAPAFALLAGGAIVVLLRRRAARVAALALVAVLAVPGYVAERHVDSKDASDWSTVVAALDEAERPGDAVVFSDLFNAQGPVRAPGRAVAVAYPRSFAALADPTLRPTAWAEGTLWDTSAPVADVAAQLRGHDRVWWLGDHAADGRGEVRDALEALGFVVDDEAGHRGSATDLVLFVRWGSNG